MPRKKKRTSNDLLDALDDIEPSESSAKSKLLILDRWELTHEAFTTIVDANPSLRGVTLGYLAEHKFHQMFLHDPRILKAHKADDHNRKRKGDRTFEYRSHNFIVEVKSLQTNLVKRDGSGWTGKSQVDASDRRKVTFKDGNTLETTCLLRNEFDILAVNCYAFGNQWQFAFILNRDIPQNQFKKYTPEQRAALLPTLVAVTWPPKPPFATDIFALLDQLADEKDAGTVPEAPDMPGVEKVSRKKNKAVA